MAINIPIITTFSDSGITAANKRLKMMAGQFPGIGLAIAGVTAAATAFGIAAFKAVGKASDFEEAMSKNKVIFGSVSEEIVKFSKEASRSLGLAQTAALNAASTFATFGKAAGMSGKELSNFSTEFVTLAADLASFNNTTVDQAVTALGAALRGESEPIRAYGVLLSDTALKAEALEMGIYSGRAALTAQQKVLATHSLVLKQTGDAQGDFNRTSQGLANQQKILKATLENVQTQLGRALLPVFTKAVKYFNDHVTPAIEKIADAFGEGGLVYGLQTVTALMGPFGKTVVGVLRQVTIGAAMTANAVLNIGTAFQKFKEALNPFGDPGKFEFMSYIDIDAIGASFDKFIEGVGQAQIVVTGASSALKAYERNTYDILQRIKEQRKEQEELDKENKKGKATVTEYAKTLKEALGKALDTATKALEDAQGAFMDFAKSVSNSLKDAFDFQSALEAGQETGTGFLDGLKSKVQGVKEYAAKIQQLLDSELSQEALSMVLDAGAEAGTAIADELIKGGQAAIDQTNALVNSANEAAAKVGLNAATKWYQSGIDVAQNMVDGLAATLDKMTPKLMAKMDKIAAKMKRTVDIDVRITEQVSRIVTTIAGGGIPKMAAGGITMGPQVALIGERGPEAVIPLSKMGNMGGITVNINGGLSTSADIGRAVVDSIRSFNRANGPAAISVSGY